MNGHLGSVSSVSMITVSIIFTLVTGAVSWLLYQLMQQNGRMLERLESLENRVADSPTSKSDNRFLLPPGAVLHDFELPLLESGSMTLSQWQGQQVLLIFFDPACEFYQLLQFMPGFSGHLNG